jgi:putative PIN family toxin of toxin-antitoxin system
VVLDTNVLVSALLTPQGPSARILDLITGLQLMLLLDHRILYEYRDVLRRPKFAFEKRDIDELIATLDRIGEFVVAVPIFSNLPDADDLPFLEVALSGKADILVTGNKKDYGRPPKGLRIYNPAEFLDYFRRTVRD